MRLLRGVFVVALVALFVTPVYGLITNEVEAKSKKDHETMKEAYRAGDEIQTMLNASTKTCKVIVAKMEGKTITDANVISNIYNGDAPTVATDLGIWKRRLTDCTSIINQKTAWKGTMLNSKED